MTDTPENGGDQPRSTGPSSPEPVASQPWAPPAAPEPQPWAPQQPAAPEPQPWAPQQQAAPEPQPWASQPWAPQQQAAPEPQPWAPQQPAAPEPQPWAPQPWAPQQPAALQGWPAQQAPYANVYPYPQSSRSATRFVFPILSLILAIALVAVGIYSFETISSTNKDLDSTKASLTSAQASNKADEAQITRSTAVWPLCRPARRH